ncbi:cupin domain-containing protein [Xenorhabdus bovienii]|uniref:cupin domain-containing protein n=1 Tax=Xenorhabdus bovienii TaxID=40576 RepID=UPI0023B29B99|nr:cupin domain-containing protein [Xenorhabdus bovienii]MDE9431518.1 cupin domain-containing protein [Xenorhabdus bovienii]MDE9489043.1 cupin domain-containing protein [Xenorhabdus bovienii]MDE9505511.1 cupin domain-containing protein [Xenorhabdus bovienii]MDE9546821.1 cupin domain-containing protein [Xenorhabdus bovienii]
MQGNIQYICKFLNLFPHPEGGYFSEFYRSKEKIKNLSERFDGDHSFNTSIYYLLPGHAVSMFHRLKQDEIWHFYEGTNVILHFLHPNGNYQKVILGRKLIDSIAEYKVLVPHGVWFSAEIEDKEAFSLVGCTATPGFEYSDWELANANTLVKKYPEQSVLIKRIMSIGTQIENENKNV